MNDLVVAKQETYKLALVQSLRELTEKYQPSSEVQSIQVYANSDLTTNASYVDVNRIDVASSNACFLIDDIQSFSVTTRSKYDEREQELHANNTKKTSKTITEVFCARKLLASIHTETLEKTLPESKVNNFVDMTLEYMYQRLNNARSSTTVTKNYKDIDEFSKQLSVTFSVKDIEMYPAYNQAREDLLKHIDHLRGFIDLYRGEKFYPSFPIDYNPVMIAKALVKDMTENFADIKQRLNRLPQNVGNPMKAIEAVSPFVFINTVDDLITGIYKLISMQANINPAQALLFQTYLSNSRQRTQQETDLQDRLIRDTVDQYTNIMTLHLKTKYFVTQAGKRPSKGYESLLAVCENVLAAMGAIVMHQLNITLIHSISFSRTIWPITLATAALSLVALPEIPLSYFSKRISNWIKNLGIVSIATLGSSVISAATPSFLVGYAIDYSFGFMINYFTDEPFSIAEYLLSKITPYLQQSMINSMIAPWYGSMCAFSFVSMSTNFLILNVFFRYLFEGINLLTGEKHYRKTESGFLVTKDPIINRVFELIKSEPFQKICEIGSIWLLTSPARHMFSIESSVINRALDPNDTMSFGTTNANVEGFFLQLYYTTSLIFTNYYLAPFVEEYMVSHRSLLDSIINTGQQEQKTLFQVLTTYAKAIKLNILLMPLGRASLPQTTDNLVNISVASMFSLVSTLIKPSSRQNYEVSNLAVFGQALVRGFQFALSDTANVLLRAYMVTQSDMLMNKLLNGFDPSKQNVIFSHLDYSEMAMFPVYMSFKVDYLKSLVGFWTYQNRAMQISLMVLFSNIMKDKAMNQYDWINSGKAILLYLALASVFKDKVSRTMICEVGKTVTATALRKFNLYRFAKTPLGRLLSKNKYAVVITGLSASSALLMAYDIQAADRERESTAKRAGQYFELTTDLPDVSRRYVNILNNPKYAQVIVDFVNQIESQDVMRRVEEKLEQQELLGQGNEPAVYQQETVEAWKTAERLVKIIDKEAEIAKLAATNPSDAFLRFYNSYKEVKNDYYNKEAMVRSDDVIKELKSMVTDDETPWKEKSFQQRFREVFEFRNHKGAELKIYEYTGIPFKPILQRLPRVDTNDPDPFYVNAVLSNSFMTCQRFLSANEFKDYMRRHMFVVDPNSANIEQHTNNRVKNLGFNVLDFSYWYLPQVTSISYEAWAKSIQELDILGFIDLAREVHTFYSISSKGVNPHESSFEDGSIYNHNPVIQQLYTLGYVVADVAKEITPEQYKLVVDIMKMGLTNEVTSLQSLIQTKDIVNTKFTWEESNKQLVTQMNNLVSSYAGYYSPVDVLTQTRESIIARIYNNNDGRLDHCLFIMALINNNKVMSKLRYSSIKDFKVHLATLRQFDIAEFYDNLFANKDFRKDEMDTFYYYFNKLSGYVKKAGTHVDAVQRVGYLENEINEMNFLITKTKQALVENASALQTSKSTGLQLYKEKSTSESFKVYTLEQRRSELESLIARVNGKSSEAYWDLQDMLPSFESEHYDLLVKQHTYTEVAERSKVHMSNFIAYEVIANQNNMAPENAVGLYALVNDVSQLVAAPLLPTPVEYTSTTVLAQRPYYIQRMSEYQGDVNVYASTKVPDMRNLLMIDIPYSRDEPYFASLSHLLHKNNTNINFMGSNLTFYRSAIDNVITEISENSNVNQDSAYETTTTALQPPQDLFWFYMVSAFLVYELILTKFKFPSILKALGYAVKQTTRPSQPKAALTAQEQRLVEFLQQPPQQPQAPVDINDEPEIFVENIIVKEEPPQKSPPPVRRSARTAAAKTRPKSPVRRKNTKINVEDTNDRFTLLEREVNTAARDFSKVLGDKWNAISVFHAQTMKKLKTSCIDSAQFCYLLSRIQDAKFPNGDPLMHYYSYYQSLMSTNDYDIYEYVDVATVFKLRSVLRSAFKYADINSLPLAFRTNVELVRKDDEFLNSDPDTTKYLVGYSDDDDLTWLLSMISPLSVFLNERKDVLTLNKHESMFAVATTLTQDDFAEQRVMKIGDVQVRVDLSNLNDCLIVKHILEQGAKKMSFLKTSFDLITARQTFANVTGAL